MFEFFKTDTGISAALFQYFKTGRGGEMTKKDKKPEENKIVGVIIEKTREIIIHKFMEPVGSRINVKENTASLVARLEVLNHMEEDVRSKLEVDENVRGVKRKREVESWLDNVCKKDVQCHKLKKEVQDLKIYHIVSYKSSEVVKRLEEVTKLIEQGRNFQGLVYETPGRDEVPLVISKVEGDAFNENLENIKDWAMGNTVWRIGIYGVEGVGKTALALQIHDYLISESSFTGGVYFITVSLDFTISNLQNEIARALKINLSDENDERKRAGILFQALSKKQNCVLILDDVQNDVDIEKIGMKDCKVIITSRSGQICRTIGCQENIKVEPLSSTEARKLFDDKYGERELHPEAAQIIQRIVEKCGGLPNQIIDTARSIRGVTDIHELRDIYKQL